MHKYALTVVFLFTIICNTYSQNKNPDTVIFYYKYNISSSAQFGSKITRDRDSADYFRLIFKPDSGDAQYNVQEYYRDGKPKFIGKSEKNTFIMENTVSFQGECISFYPNGKRHEISLYEHGTHVGLDYVFFPNGHLYYVKNYIHNPPYTEQKYVDCYDINGNNTTKDGNGRWVVYDYEFKDIFIEGIIKNGYPEGEWKGSTNDKDSIRFIYTYKKGQIIGAKGIDKAGVEHPFTQTAVPSSYSGNLEVLVASLRRKILPKGEKRNKKIIDSLTVTFTLKKDGSISDVSVLGSNDSTINTVAQQILNNNKSWKPRTYYGIPIESKIRIPLSEQNIFGRHGFWEEIEFTAKDPITE